MQLSAMQTRNLGDWTDFLTAGLNTYSQVINVRTAADIAKSNAMAAQAQARISAQPPTPMYDQRVAIQRPATIGGFNVSTLMLVGGAALATFIAIRLLKGRGHA